MRILTRILLVTFLLGQPILWSESDFNRVEADRSQVLAFTNVSVIPMDRERILRDQTVIVRNGQIDEIGPTGKVRVPASALRVNGQGKYLMPGLIDMHTHLLSDDKFPDSLAGDELAIMVANGVTTIRLMIGTPEHLKLREQVAKGTTLGPTIYVASPQLAGRSYGKIFNGRAVATPEEARQAVRDFHAAGYDFIKLTYWISRPVYDAVIEEAKVVGIRVVGHVDTQIGLARALEAGQQIEHLDSYFEAIIADNSPIKDSVSNLSAFRLENWQSLDHIDDKKLIQAAESTAKAKVWTCPTLTFFKLAFGLGQSEEQIRSRPDYRFFRPRSREATIPRPKFWDQPPSEERRKKYVQVRNRLVKEIHNVGGKILAGSDTPEWFLLYGYTLHREIKSLAEAGLSPYAALEAATRNPAEFLNALDNIGTVEKGKRADLILLDANPLEDVTNTEKISGVVVKGRWLPKSELEKMLDQIAIRFQEANEEKN